MSRFPEKDVYTDRDLAQAAGLGRDKTRALMRSGELPGYVLGRAYVVPYGLFWAFVNGTWTPASQRQVTPVAPLSVVHTRRAG